MNKFEHVRVAQQTRNHECHWPGCSKQVPPAMWGCKFHWMKIPWNLRNRLWTAYETGQEEDGIISWDYITAAETIQDWIRVNNESLM